MGEIKDMTLEQLRAKKVELEAQEPLDVNEYNRICNRINELAFEEDQKAQQEQRLQAQTADLEDIKLPNDYNAIFADPRANDEIVSLLRQAKEQLYAAHNDEISKLHADHKAQLDQMQSAVSELSDRSTKAQQALEAEQADHADTKRLLNNEQAQRKEAEQNRNNAVSLKEEAEAERDRLAKENASLKGQIDELEGMVRTLKKPTKATGGLQLTSSLKPETDDERKARLERQRVETINRNLERRGIEPLKLPEIPSKQADTAEVEQEVTKEQLEAAFPGAAGGSSVVQGDAGGEGVSEAQKAVAQAGDATAASTIEERVAALEKAVFGQKEQVA